MSTEKTAIFDSFLDLVDVMAHRDLPVHPKDVQRIARAAKTMKLALIEIYDKAEFGSHARDCAIVALRYTFGDDWHRQVNNGH